MEKPIDFAVTVRALIVDKGELLMVKHRPEYNYHALPGGRLELNESLEAGLERELVEELGIRPEIGRLLFVNQWLSQDRQRIEFFFWIKNGADYRRADPGHASHGFEIASLTFGDAGNTHFNILPSFLQQKYPQILELGEDYPTELIRSY